MRSYFLCVVSMCGTVTKLAGVIVGGVTGQAGTPYRRSSFGRHG